MFNPQPSNGFEREAPEQDEGFQRPGTGTTTSGTEGDTEGSHTINSAGDASQGNEESLPEPALPTEPESQPEEQQQQHQQQQQGQAQEPRRPAKPQFKLQAKVTGLERTGKKDPILRFDVHVNTHVDVLASLRLTILDQPPSLSHYTIPRRSPSTLRVRQAGRAPHIRQPRSARPSCPAARHFSRRRDRRG